MKVTIIGTGNVAHVLGRRCISVGHEVVEVAGRSEDKITELASTLKAGACLALHHINQSSDLYLIAVADAAISSIADKIQVGDKVVAHTAGSVSRNVLQGCSSSYGVIYPLQSLRREINAVPVIPVLVDANNAQTNAAITDFAASWADSVHFANDEERLKIHVAAVVVNNFTNHLFTLTEQFCSAEHLEFNLLYPLIEETLARIKNYTPSSVQTGPAVRADFATIEKHLAILSQHHYLRELYKMLSSNIVDYYRKIK